MDARYARDVFVIPAPQTLHGRANWPGLVSLVMMITRRIVGTVETGYVRYFLKHPAGYRRSPTRKSHPRSLGD